MITETRTADLFFGLVVGTVAGICAGIVVSNNILSEIHKINETAVVAAHAQGRHEALSTTPPSMELEITCANIWANKVAVPRALEAQTK